jgi:hypothetical protein
LARGSVLRKASTYTGKHNRERRKQTSMPRGGFEPAIPMFERPKTVLALDRSAIETGFTLNLPVRKYLKSFLSLQAFRLKLCYRIFLKSIIPSTGLATLILGLISLTTFVE